jgi:hypothetical protein
MIYIYDNTESKAKELADGGVITQYEHIKEWCTAKGFDIESFNIDENEDAKTIADTYNLTVFPVLFWLGDNEVGELTFKKFAEGIDGILLLSDNSTKELVELVAISNLDEPAKKPEVTPPTE